MRFLLRVTLRRHDLAAEVYHLKEPQKLPLVMSPDETKRLLAMARSIKVRVVLSLGYGCGLRAGEVVRLQVKHIDSAQGIIRIAVRKAEWVVYAKKPFTAGPWPMLLNLPRATPTASPSPTAASSRQQRGA